MDKNKSEITYLKNLVKYIKKITSKNIDLIVNIFLEAKKNKKTIYICGNGGSAANANHISNDLMLGLNSKKFGFKIISLSSNIAQISCIANDINYSNIFSHQLKILCSEGDVLIVLSGSGNSKNIIEAIKVANRLNMHTLSILGFEGGKAKKISKENIHFKINDMQISEDLQMVLFNSAMKKMQKFFP